MATLHLGDPDRKDTNVFATAAAPALREWLGGGWGLLFSHPEDFEARGFEQDRWLTIVGEKLQACDVRPLACGVRALACARATGEPDASWIGDVTGDRRLVRLDGPVADLAARLLRIEITALGSQSHFVLAVDAGLRRRGLFRYRPQHAPLSPLDLLASLQALRRRGGETRRAA